LLSHDDLAAASAPFSIDFRLAEVNVRVHAPSRIVSVLEATLSNVPRFGPSVSPQLTLSVMPKDEAWEIHGLEGAHQVMSGLSALPQVAGAVVSSAVRNVAASRRIITMRATVMERDGRAIALIGDDWESAITLATHFHGRGWTYVGTDNALLDPDTREVFCIQKSLYVNSSSLAQLPLQYRSAVEASPWYVTPQGISFYAVDPSGVNKARTWTHSAALSAIVIVDGGMADRPSLETVDRSRLRDDRFARLNLDWDQVPVIDLQIGTYVESCDLIEHWFGSLPS
jgi:hypothetical protein